VNHHPRKRFGQNFLQDTTVIEQIITHLNVQHDDNIVEIGPGLGALTKPLLKKIDNLTAIEIDRDLHLHLTQLFALSEKIALINADALTVDYGQLGRRLRVVGNLPYNISTPLLLYLLQFKSTITDMHFMLQKEVVDRLTGRPGTKNYGRLSIMMQYHCEVQLLMDVPASAFYPPPKVMSAIVRLVPYQCSPFSPVSITTLQRVVAQAFSMRRKMIANNLKPLFTVNQLLNLGINPTLRPEQIAIVDYIKIANSIS
jgi:16S rRNA (adenine1518-N6/adenine1519-N6)-dimethyltransferase